MRLRLGTDFLDQYENTDIAQIITVNPLNDISSRNGSFSNKFKLPLTSNNSNLLGFPQDVNSTSRNPYTQVDVDLVDLGSVIATGYLKFKLVNNLTNELECTFFSSNSDWFSQIKDKTLKDLNLSEFNHSWDFQTIADRIDADPDKGHCYPLIDYGEFSALTALTVDDTSMYPGIFFHTVITQIFNDIEWKVNGELTDSPLYQRMIIPFSDTNFQRSNKEILASTEDNSPFDTVTTTPPSNNDMTVSAVGTFQPSASGKWNIKVVFEYDSFKGSESSNLVTFQIRDTVTGALTFKIKRHTVDGSFTTTLELTDVDVDITTTSYIARLVQNTNGGNTNSSDVTGGSLSFSKAQPYTESGDAIDMASTLPNILQSDFVRYAFFSFGIIPQANNKTKTLTLDFFKSLKDNIPNAVDWSNKLDLSKKSSTDFTRLLNNYATVSIMTYLEDTNDTDLETYKSEKGKVFGQGQFDIENEFIVNKKTIYTAPFASMFNKFSFDDVAFIPNIPFLTDDGGGGFERSITPVPRVAIMTKNISVPDLTGGDTGYVVLTINEDVSAAPGSDTVAAIPFCYFAKPQIADVFDDFKDSLVFDQIETNGFEDLTLKEQFLSDYEFIFSNMKYLRAFFLLTEVDINELDFSVPVFIDRFKAYFYVSKINNYRGSTDTTEAEVVKIS